MKKIISILAVLITTISFSTVNSMSPTIRKISVTGEVEREINPDIAIISFESKAKKDTLAAATKEANENIEKFKKELQHRNIKFSNLETTAVYNNKTKEFISDSDDFKGIKNEEKNNKKPLSHTASLVFVIKNTDFSKIANILNSSDDNTLQQLQKNYDENAFNFYLTSTETTIDKALSSVFNKFNNLKTKLISTGINENNILLNEYKLTENFDTNKNRQKDVFNAVNRFNITTNSINDLNTLISIASDNNIDIYGNIKFDISNRDEIESQIYSEAFNQAKTKATSILKSSDMKLYSPLVVSEDVDFQRKMMDRIDNEWEVETKDVYRVERVALAAEYSASRKVYTPVVDYKPKPLKITQNISVLYEIK